MPSASTSRRKTSRRSGTRFALARCWKTWFWTRIATPTTTTIIITENTRADYPVEFIDGAVIPGVGRPPEGGIVSHRGRLRRAAAASRG